METQKAIGLNKSRLQLIFYWIFTSLIFLEMFVGAFWDLFRIGFVKDVFTHLGYPFYLLTILGVWKLAGSVVLIIPRFPVLKEWTYAGMFFTYSGAAASHFAAGDPPGNWMGPLIFVA